MSTTQRSMSTKKDPCNKVKPIKHYFPQTMPNLKNLKSLPNIIRNVNIGPSSELFKLKIKVLTCLYDDNYCCLCLDNHSLSPANDKLQVVIGEKSVYLTIAMIIKKILDIDVNREKICIQCKTKALSSYMFISETKQIQTSINELLKQLDLNSTETELEKNLEEKGETLEEKYNVILVLEDPPEQGNTDNNINKYTCQICGEIKYTKYDMTQHSRTVHGMPTNVNKTKSIQSKCPVCKNNDVCPHVKYLFHFELQKKYGLDKPKCLECPFMCRKKTTLINHLKKHMKLIKCKFCDLSFASISLAKHELECCQVMRPFPCTQCQASFDTQKKLDNHFKSHDSTLTFTSAVKPKLQKKTQNNDDSDVSLANYIHKCSVCNENSPNLKNFKEHILNHSPNEKYFCDTCKINCDNRIEFLNHLSKVGHKSKIEPSLRKHFKCDHCDFSTTTTDCLQSHVNRYHLKTTPFQCHLCPKAFCGNQRLKEHLKSHSAIKTHSCEFCNMKFCGSSALKKHMRRHTGDKPHKCDKCDLKFITSNSLHLHMLKAHKGKFVQCPKCSSKFLTETQMRHHFKRVHWKFTGEEFDIRKVEGLTEEQYDMFRDKRMLVL